MKSLTFLKDNKNDRNSRYQKWNNILEIEENYWVIADLFWLTVVKFFL